MLADYDPEEWAEIEAAYETATLDDGWRQADTIAGAIHDEAEINRQVKAGRRSLDKTRMHKRGQYIPRVRLKKTSVKVNQSSIDITQRIIESQFLA